MTRSTRLALYTLAAYALFGGTITQAIAQQDVSGQTIPSLKYPQADVREVLRALFKDVGVSYTIAPEVQGTVSVSLKNVTFSAALGNILRQVDATCLLESGVYRIFPRENASPSELDKPKPEVGKKTRPDHIASPDPYPIAIIIGAGPHARPSMIFPEFSSIVNYPARSSDSAGAIFGAGCREFGTGRLGRGGSSFGSNSRN